MLLSIESSCDEAACTIFNINDFINGKVAIKSLKHSEIFSQIDSHVAYGGVVPEIAAREHIKTLPILLNNCLKNSNTNIEDLTLISVTSGPGLKGCLLAGVSLAKGIASSSNLPLFPINHLEAHILSIFSDCSQLTIQDKLPALVLLVSGGNTLIVLVSEIGKYRILCSTQDDAAGEAFDKIGSLLGFGYPAGKKISEYAKLGTPSISLPIGVKNIPDQFSFSGLKTAANLILKAKSSNMLGAEDQKKYISDFSSSLQKTIIDTLIQKTKFWDNKLNEEGIRIKRLGVCGGVASNELLREQILNIKRDSVCDIYIPPLTLCTDNSDMIAIATAFRIGHFFANKTTNLQELDNKFPILARWPLEEVDPW